MSLYPVLCFQCGETVDDKIRKARALVTPDRRLDRVISELYPTMQVCCVEKLLCSVETIPRQVINSASVRIRPTIDAMKFRPNLASQTTAAYGTSLSLSS